MYFFAKSLILMLLLSLQPGDVELISSQVKVFSDNYGTAKFNNLAIFHSEVEDGHDSVFIGAVNRLYQLSHDLELLAKVTTWPLPVDSSFKTDQLNNKSMNNYNKILVMNTDDKRLITCGTVPMCTIYDLHSNAIISESNARKVFEPVVTNSENASTLAFIGTIHIIVHEFDEDVSKKRLWIAQSNVGDFPKGDETPAFAARDINSLQPIKGIFFFDGYRDEYIVNYIYGFQSGKNKNYLLTTQQNSTTQRSPYVSKLTRMCAQGNLLSGYAEIPIECIVEGDRPYDLVQAAYVGKASAKLAKSMNIHHDNDVLFAVFSPSQDIYSQKPSNRSALCVYSLKAIDQKFDENIEHCSNGNGYTGLEFIAPERVCFEKWGSDPFTDYCQRFVNAPVGGAMPLRIHAALTLETHITAIAAKSSENQTDVFVGTNAGHLKKIVVQNVTYAYEHGDITIEEQSPVNSDLLFSSKENYLFVMTQHTLAKVDLRTTF